MIYISTNMYAPMNLMKILPILESLPKGVGIELFPMFHHDKYDALLWENRKILQSYPFSFHGPYYGAEHSAGCGSKQYEDTAKLFGKMMKYEKIFHPKYIVYHFNNCKIHDPKKMEKISRENLRTLRSLYTVPIVVENTGVNAAGNVLFAQEKFIEVCKEEKGKVLIDIGHANANQWNLEKVISDLKDQIISYHLHSNDGIHDDHDRIFQKGPDMGQFLNLYKKYTPHSDLVLEYSMKYEDKREEVITDVLRLMEELKKRDLTF